MSERMNKERAREELTLMRYNLKMGLEETQATHWTDDKTTYDKRVELLTDSIQALDIAIESLEQDQQTKEKMWAKQLNECEECEVINNEWVDVRDRLPSEEEIKKNNGKFLATAIGLIDVPFVIVKQYRITEGRFRDRDCKIIAWKPLPQPYERKE